MTPEELRAWRKGKWLSLRQLSLLLGVSTNTVHRWEMGTHPIGRIVELALAGLEARGEVKTRQSP